MSKEKQLGPVVLGFYRPRPAGLGDISFGKTPDDLKHSAKQEFKDECDINNLMKRYERTGVLEHVNRMQGSYGDFTDVVDFATAFDVVRRAEIMFLTLPARIREDFGNDPGRFLQFATDPANASKMVEYGLAKPVEDPAPPAASAAAPAAAPAPSGGTAPGA